MATHSSILAWRIHGQGILENSMEEEPVRHSPKGSKELVMTE